MGQADVWVNGTAVDAPHRPGWSPVNSLFGAHRIAAQPIQAVPQQVLRSEPRFQRLPSRVCHARPLPRRVPVPAEAEQELRAEYRDLDDLLRESDFVSLHTNLTPQTRHLINATRLALMKPTAVLVNTSRGPVMDEQALVHALQEGQIFAAGLDVFEHEPGVHPGLLACHNAVLIPHLGSATVQTRLAMANLAADNLLAGLEDRHPPALLNPEAWQQRAPKG